MASAVWSHFTQDIFNKQFANCKHCGSRISRGASKSTSSMFKHLKTIHNIVISNKKGTPSTSSSTSTCVSTPMPNIQQRLVGEPSKQSGPENQEIEESAPDDSFSLTVDVSSDFTFDSFDADTSRPPPSSTPVSTISPSTSIQPPSPQSFASIQPTLSSYLDSKIKFKPGDYRASKITDLIARMICVDGQPFSIVENQGFRDLIYHLEPRYRIPDRKYFSNKKIPEMYHQTKKNVIAELEKVNHVGVTTDMWTSVANQDYLALTLHFLDDEYNFKHLCVEVIPFAEVSHTGVNICSFISKVLQDWKVEEKVTAIVRDNGRNIVSALEMSPYAHTSCLAHTLQLVLKDGLLNSKVFTSLTATSRRIVGHFKHSAGATKTLKTCQATAKVKCHRMVQDEPTRWNSTLHMLKRLKEQKTAILLAASEIENFPAELTSSQWSLVDNIIPVLNIFDSATEQVSSKNVSASEVIPLTTVITKNLESRAPFGSGLQGVKNDLLTSMRLRFSATESEKTLALACLLDPRFKNKPFTNETCKQNAIIMLREEANSTFLKINQGEQSGGEAEKVIIKKGSIWEEYQQFSQHQTTSEMTNADSEVDRYLNEACEPPSTKVGKYWLSRSYYPTLRLLAKKYLCVPPATVFSERLFSTAGIICDTKRNRLDPERVKMLVFLQKNLPDLH